MRGGGGGCQGWGTPYKKLSAEGSLQGTHCRSEAEAFEGSSAGCDDVGEGCMHLGNRPLLKDTAVYLSSSFIQLDAQTP